MHKNGMLPFHNPGTDEIFGEVLMSTPEEIARAFAEMRRNQRVWGDKSPAERARILKKFQQVLVQYADEIASVINQDTGKIMQDGLAEVYLVVDKLHNYCAHASRWLAREQIPPGVFFLKRYYTEQRPVGVVAVIGPWNLPLDLTVPPMFAALLAGNTVILKPSEIAPATGVMVEKLVQSVPELSPYVRVLHGDAKVGAEMVRCRPDLIFLTGSPSTGRVIARAAAEHLIPFLNEMGGKDPMVVLEDADIRTAAEWAAWGAFYSTGHTCVSIERIYVVEEVYDAFLDAMVEATRNFKVGYSPEKVSDFDLGPVSNERQIDIIEEHVADALQKGAQIVIGGRRTGNFMEPTILVNVDHSMTVMREETFGPVVGVMKVRDEAEAIAMANDNDYGLAGAVWSRDMKRAERVAHELELGSVVVNDTIVQYAVPLLPFGGVKQSGNARTHCREEVLQFTKARSYAVGAAPMPFDPAALFRKKGAYHLISATMHLLRGVTPAQRLEALPEMGRYLKTNLRRQKPHRLAVGAGKTTLVAAGAVAAGAAAATVGAVTFAVLRGRRR